MMLMRSGFEAPRSREAAPQVALPACSRPWAGAGWEAAPGGPERAQFEWVHPCRRVSRPESGGMR
eukprot:1296523-Alexandrium_andersonii.AAC.1